MSHGPVVMFIALLMVLGPAMLLTGSGGQFDSSRLETLPVIDGSIGTGEYESSKNIDEGKFELFWTTIGPDIFIGMRATVIGWLSLGLDPANNMTNADMIFGWVSAGTPYVKDAFCTNEIGNHPEDTTYLGGTYDIDDFDGTESAGVTTIELKRAMSTGDAYDKKFVNGTSIKVIWATCNEDGWNNEHDDAGFETMLMDGTPPPPPPVSNELDGIITTDEYRNSTTYDSGNFQLYWNVSGPNITIAMKALTTGWVSLGISPVNMMQGADLLIGGKGATSAYSEDHFATTTTAHSADTDIGGTDDIKAYNATESGGWTTLEIKRALVTGDTKDKNILIGTPLNIIWAVGGSDDVASLHSKRGYGTWRVDASTPPPPPPPPKSDFDGVITTGEYSNFTKTDSDRFELYWDLNVTSIDIGIRAQVTGYLSIGIDPTVQMKDADMIFGWVAGGKAGSEDHYGTSFTTHMRDEDLGGTFDVISYNGTESGGWTTFEFRRNLTTGDTNDRTIKTEAAFPLIWAVSDLDDPTATHLRRGTMMWNLSNATPPPPPPPPPPHGSSFDGIISAGEYSNFTTMDSGRFELHWNLSAEKIKLGLRAQATGWVSLGIDPTDQMAGADFIMGGLAGTVPYAEDHYGNSPTTHIKDSILGGQDDILDYNATEAGGWTTLELERNLTTSDANDKAIVPNGTVTVIWAVSDSDDPSAKHSRTGSKVWDLRVNATPPPPPPPPPKNTTLDGIVSEGEYDDQTSFGGGALVVHWSVNGSKIWMALVGRTTGWVSIGFEPIMAMKDADMIFGWVANGTARAEDHFGTGATSHARDEELGGKFDIVSFNGTEAGGNTTIEFVRELNASEQYDRPIPSKGAVDVIWAVGGDDDPTSTHVERGSGTILLYRDAPKPSTGLDGKVSQGEYKDSATFDFDNFRVYWTIEGQKLHMAISAMTTGWVSIGFDPEDIMKGSDVVLGWVESGKVHIIDAYSTGQYGPHPPDTHLGGTMDIHLYNGSESDGMTTIEFIRNLTTGDDNDKPIPTIGTLKVMWAYGESDDFGETHSKRGFAVLTMGQGGIEPPTEADLDGMISHDEYDFNGTFGDGLITIFWKVEGDSIRIALQAKTTGWVSLGIGYSTAMADSDMIFGWVDPDGAVHVVDTFSTGPTGPHPTDISKGGTNDISSFGGKEINGVTTIEFARELDTGDEWDNPIPRNGTVKIIWGIGVEDSIDAKHTRVGYGTIDIESGETTSEESVVLWPFHAILMVLGTGGMVTATLVLFRRKWRHFFKFHMWVMTAATILGGAGLLIGFYMVQTSTGQHLRVLHSWFGLLTLLVSIFALGVGFYFKYTKNMKHKRPSRTIHKYAGWAGAVMFLLTSVSGFLQAVVIGGSKVEPWFVLVMAAIGALFIGIAVFLLTKGRPKPVTQVMQTVVEEKAPEPIEAPPTSGKEPVSDNNESKPPVDE